MVVPGGVDRSGQERVIPALLWLIERLARRHALTVIATSQERDYCEYGLRGARVICLGSTGTGIPVLKQAQQVARFNRALRSLDGLPDIFHAISAAEIGALTGLAGRRMGVPVVTSLFGGELAWLPGIRYGRQGNLPGRWSVRLAIRLADVVTAGSRYAGAALAPQPWRFVPLGVEDALFASPIGRTPGPPWRLMHVAHINPVKDQAVLLRAVQRMSAKVPVRLDWFGQDTLGGKMQDLAVSLGLAGTVHFHGVRPTDELIPFYRQAHLLLQTSQHESQGVAVCEAAAAGVPTVGTAVGLVEELAPGAAAAVPVGDDAALAEAAVDLLADPEKREALGSAAQTWAQQHNADWTARTFEAIYAACIDD